MPKHAFTLAEVLIAGALVTVIAATLFGAFSMGFTVIQISRDDLRATQIMMQKMEAIRLFTWSQVLNTNYLKPVFQEYYDPAGVTSGSQGSVYTGFVTATVPTNVASAYETNMRTITVTLYWTNYNGRKPIIHSRQMQSNVAKNGMQNYVWGGS
jgi:Tfp pilus assembly protein PilV